MAGNSIFFIIYFINQYFCKVHWIVITIFTQYKFIFYLKYIYYFASHSRSVLEKGFGDSLLLPDSDKFDCGMCVHALDVDFDGENELLLGTYGQVRARVVQQPVLCVGFIITQNSPPRKWIDATLITTC